MQRFFIISTCVLSLVLGSGVHAQITLPEAHSSLIKKIEKLLTIRDHYANHEEISAALRDELENKYILLAHLTKAQQEPSSQSLDDIVRNHEMHSPIHSHISYTLPPWHERYRAACIKAAALGTAGLLLIAVIANNEQYRTAIAGIASSLQESANSCFSSLKILLGLKKDDVAESFHQATVTKNELIENALQLASLKNDLHFDPQTIQQACNDPQVRQQIHDLIRAQKIAIYSACPQGSPKTHLELEFEEAQKTLLALTKHNEKLVKAFHELSALQLGPLLADQFSPGIKNKLYDKKVCDAQKKRVSNVITEIAHRTKNFNDTITTYQKILHHLSPYSLLVISNMLLDMATLIEGTLPLAKNANLLLNFALACIPLGCSTLGLKGIHSLLSSLRSRRMQQIEKSILTLQVALVGSPTINALAQQGEVIFWIAQLEKMTSALLLSKKQKEHLLRLVCLLKSSFYSSSQKQLMLASWQNL